MDFWPWLVLGSSAVAVVVVLMVMGVISTSLFTGHSQLEEDMVRVPNVVNKEADEAEHILSESVLGMSRDKMVYSDEIPQDMISYQSQKENATVPANTVIVVEISMGKEKAVFPAVAGLCRRKRKSSLRKAGLPILRSRKARKTDCTYPC